MKRVGEDTLVDLDGAKSMLNYFDQLLSPVDSLNDDDSWPETIQITVSTSALCDFRTCLLKLVEMLDQQEAEGR